MNLETSETHKSIDFMKLRFTNNKITRKQISFFDNRHRQVTTVDPLPKEGKYTIKFKIIMPIWF